MSRGTILLIATGACALGLLGGYRLHVMAEGAPTPPSLFYAGTLEDDGAPVDGEVAITLTIHDAESGGDQLCTAEGTTRVDAGRFRLDASACADALRGNPNAWVAVSFEGSDGTPRAIEGRSKIGAVPYALEADHALSSSSAKGALATQLEALVDRVEALESESGFLAHKSSEQMTEPPPTYNPIVFNDEVFDFGDEYNAATGTFTTRDGGYYEFSCLLVWATAHGSAYQWEAQLFVDGTERAYSGFVTDGFATTRQVDAVFKLEPNQSVRCNGYQESPTAQPLKVAGSSCMFSGRRFRSL